MIAIGRYLQSMPDLIEAEKRPDTKTNVDRMVMTYRVRPHIYKGLVDADSGYIQHNVIGENPTSSATKAKAVVRNEKAANAKVAPKQKSAPAAEAHQVVDPALLEDWSMEQPPAKGASKAVMGGSEWRNGYVFWGFTPDKEMIRLGVADPTSSGYYRERKLMSMPNKVKVANKAKT